MRQPGYITIEQTCENKDFEGISSLILDEFSNAEVSLIEECEYYFVIKFICEDFEEIQEIASTISYILIGEGIHKFILTLNCDE
jgi:hypothetical protein